MGLKDRTGRSALYLALVVALLAGLVVVAAGCPQQAADDQAADQTTEEPKTEEPEAPTPPEQKPSAVRGKAVYEANCQTCHGENGDGKGPAAEGLDKAPADFTDVEFIRREKPDEFFNIVTNGRAPMPAFGSLSEQERWDAIFYSWSFGVSADDITAGKALYEKNCATCHGDAGLGDGPAGAELEEKPTNFSDFALMNRHRPNQFFKVMTEGEGAMPAFPALSEDERWQVLAYERTFSYDPPQTQQ